MKKEEIHLDDWQRILFGVAPPEFLVEVLIRTVITYLILLVIVRWLGKRMSGQLTIMEMAVMLTLGAIVSVAMQVPDRGILLSAVVLLCTLAFQRGLGWLGYKNNVIENITQGTLNILVIDGKLQLNEMEKCRISKQQLFAHLRSKEIYQLGKVKRVYLEAGGLFSIFPASPPQPGLSLLPPDDTELMEALPKEVLVACINCGYVQASEDKKNCHDCGQNNWIPAIN
ncbi:DUF421 domain-containing protein [Mucilaginibacter pallidiroseus]|uniref:DUF421 domain-containing protein n=1 Tax=Mucilaginibacter pallidiroseus TaxID=2599295 RepID=A0A563UJT7_9SPHI|nr:YetF domain-containing protein [Mucilaginibacter pallidiroseus]TWR31548.1 DUF421 domain-containing protein [Mucilaginibacter pallidiroseus]